MFSTFSNMFSFISKVHKSSHLITYFKYNVASGSAITTIRSTIRRIFFSSKGNLAIAAVTSLNQYFGLIYKHSFTSVKLLIIILNLYNILILAFLIQYVLHKVQNIFLCS